MRLLYSVVISLVLFGTIPILADSYRVQTPEEIHQVLDKVKPGDAIVLKNGTWKDAIIIFSANTDLLPI